jgi:hypothetical protein
MSAVSSNFRGAVFMVQSWNRPRGQSSRPSESGRGACAGLRRLDPLAHMNEHPASKRLGAVDRVGQLCVERDIGCKSLIGLQSNFEPSGVDRALLDVSKQQAPITPALSFRRDREILDPQMIGSQDRLDESGEGAIDEQKVDGVLGHRALIVRLHRQRLPPDQRDPFGVGRARQAADDLGVRGDGRADFDAGNERCHRPDSR